MKKRTREDGGNGVEGSKSINMMYKNKKLKEKKKMRGLSLEAFANAKSKSNHYNPALIKKQREFYKNAKHVTKYRKSLKQQSQQSELSSAIRTYEDDNKTANCSKTNRKSNKHFSLREVYEKKHEEEEKKRMEREAIIQAKKEERENANARRKATRQMMYKKTRSGQPVMKYRIEHLLETLQGASRNTADTTPLNCT